MTRQYSTRCLSHATALALCLASAPADAQDDGDWSFQVTPYAFLAGLDGTVAVGGASADVEASFSDLLDRLDVGAMLTVEAWRERWGLLLDAFYVALGEEGDLALARLPVVHSEFDSDMLMASPRVGYRVTPLGSSTTTEVVAGIRYWHLSNTLELSSEGLPTFRAEQDQDWVDPIVGVQVTAALGQRWLAAVRGDVGGFGAASDFTWQAFGAFAYRFHSAGRYAVSVGYRFLDLDHESGDFGFDVLMHGPLVGFTVRW